MDNAPNTSPQHRHQISNGTTSPANSPTRSHQTVATLPVESHIIAHCMTGSQADSTEQETTSPLLLEQVAKSGEDVIVVEDTC